METKRREITIDKYYLPPEVWTLVLARLPVRTLLRMRCVCKSWLCIIDDPNFASWHLSLFNTTLKRPRYLTLESERRLSTEKPTQQLHIRHFNVNKKRKFRKSATIPIPGKFQVIGCARGLMLIERPRSHQLELWNSSTRNSFVIPTPPSQRPIDGWQFAFGFAPSSGNTDCDRDVKVVAIPYRWDPLLGSVKTLAIYSLQSRSWRTKQMNMDLESCKLYMKWKPLFHGGALHWLAGHDGHYLGWTLAQLCPTHLCSFHLGSEEFELVELPNFEEDYPGEVARRFSCLLGESLAIFGITESRRCIWVMQKDGDRVSWTTKWYSSDPTPLKDQELDYVFWSYEYKACEPLRGELVVAQEIR
ncbi:hypothetical protein Cgig2_006226 [Carnegiea gigantea]|uniref:F-box domain-containing protein n=1 Tax=Carnegiea gigantea TaxID=171969 RepID=A0A9Q1GT81_9CARY|nr:hypothetical protein Cgig2_030577 [Carnegiea gigantea]KAJ8452421.1 hypothetical protein Cgig2_006226 [Carnegiea gigantea]